MKIRPTLAVLAVTAALGGGAAFTAAPALACGDTPGFCPNPPGDSTSAGHAQARHEYHVPGSGVRFE
jgi:hypothetical protein